MKFKLLLMGMLGTGIVIGIVLVSNLDFVHNGNATDNTAAPLEEKEVVRGIEKLDNISKVFASVSRKVKPFVVSIKTEKVVKPSRNYQRSPGPYGSPFEDFFDHFFPSPSPERERLQTALGSGVLVDKKGYILTNNHVVANFDKIKVVLSDDRSFDAEIVGTDPRSDLAVIKIKAKDDLPAAELGNSDNIEVGEWVLAIGNPFGFSHTVTAGIISAKGRSNLNLADYENFLQTDAAINPGNSGGALVSLKGKLIGINTAIASRTGSSMGIGFAIPINMAKKIMQDLISKGKVVRGWLGVSIQDIDKDIAAAEGLKDNDGSLVISVLEDSPAEKAGFKSRDVIRGVAGKPIKNSDQLRNNIANISPGSKIKIEILRDKKKKILQVTLGELPSDQSLAQRPEIENKEILGIKVEAITSDLKNQYGFNYDKGVVITDILSDGPAAQSNLRRGDVLKEINRTKIKSIRDYERVAAKIKPGDSVLVLIDRRGSTFYVGIKINKK